MYMAFWVKGSIKGMIEGKVSRRWAKKHHPRWYREVERLEAKKRVGRHLVPPFLTVHGATGSRHVLSARHAGLPAQRAGRKRVPAYCHPGRENVIAHRLPSCSGSFLSTPSRRAIAVFTSISFGRAGDT
jgi:hypothetical protein